MIRNCVYILKTNANFEICLTQIGLQKYGLLFENWKFVQYLLCRRPLLRNWDNIWKVDMISSRTVSFVPLSTTFYNWNAWGVLLIMFYYFDDCICSYSGSRWCIRKIRMEFRSFLRFGTGMKFRSFLHFDTTNNAKARQGVTPWGFTVHLLITICNTSFQIQNFPFLNLI